MRIVKSNLVTFKADQLSLDILIREDIAQMFFVALQRGG